MYQQKGKIIAAFGIPGSGKSTTTKEIGEILGIETFHEPEEENWGEAVKLRELSGNFTALMWFRSIRFPQYFKANKIRNDKKTCMLDSCYDKLFHLYHEKEGLSWLFSPEDFYYDEMVSIAKKDYANLPDLDIIIFFKQTEENWKKFIKQRNRVLDNEDAFKKSFILQNAFIEAVQQYCKEKKCELIIHQQSFTNPRAEAEKIIKKIKKYL